MLLTLEHLARKALSYLGVMAVLIQATHRAFAAVSRSPIPAAGVCGGSARVVYKRPPVLAELRRPPGGQSRPWARGGREGPPGPGQGVSAGSW